MTKDLRMNKTNSKTSFNPAKHASSHAASFKQSMGTAWNAIKSGEGGAIDKKTIIVLAVAFVLVAAALGVMAQRSTQTKVFPMHVIVTGGIVGFNVTPMLEFGSVPNGGTSRKTMVINNDYGMDKMIYLRTSGAIEGWASVSDNSFYLKPGQTRNISIYVTVPRDAPAGNYYGRFEVTYTGVRG